MMNDPRIYKTSAVIMTPLQKRPARITRRKRHAPRLFMHILTPWMGRIQSTRTGYVYERQMQILTHLGAPNSEASNTGAFLRMTRLWRYSLNTLHKMTRL